MQSVRDLIAYATESMPALIPAVTLVVVGGGLAYLARMLAGRLAKGLLDTLRGNVHLGHAVEESGVASMAPRVVAAFVFWSIFLIFLAAAVQSLGITVVTEFLGQFTGYLPSVLAAVAILAVGVIVGRVVRRTVSAGARSADIRRADGLGQVAQAAVLLVAIVVALEQIGIDAQLLVSLVTVVVGSAFLSVALAFGMGARTTVSNIVSAYYVAQSYKVGQTVRIGDIEGEILQLTPTSVAVGTSEGRVLIPASRFSEEVSVLRVGVTAP